MTPGGRGFRRLAAVAAGLLIVASVQTVRAVAPTFRIEVHSLATQTPTTTQLLTGTGGNAPPATIAGELSLPFAAADRLPAVIFLHGDAGIIADQVAWIDELNAMGIAVFTLDSFSGRGAISPGASIASMPDSVGGTARVVDAERALAMLARHPRIDPQRIAVMGVSSGGRTVITAAMSRFAGAWGTPGLAFSAYIALYPPCNVQLIDDTKMEPGPLRIFHGEADVVTSAEACSRYVDRLRRAGNDAAIRTFPGAHHGFDNVANPGLIRLPDAPNGARCRVEERTIGVVLNADTGRPIGLGDACFGKGIVAGYDAAADAATKQAVKELLAERFGLKR